MRVESKNQTYSQQTGSHQPVMLTEAVNALQVKPDGCYIDGTFGRGGHSAAILEQLGESGRLYAFDKDAEAVNAANARLTDQRFYIDHAGFEDLEKMAQQFDIQQKVDGLLLDLGVSSPQIDDAKRGFSFMQDGPLDMRMDRDRGESASDWLAYADETDIAKVLKDYGEERFGRRIARAIVDYREKQPLMSTHQLAELVSTASPFREKHKHPATRTFQAIRIFINRELDELQTCLRLSLDVLAAGARLVVISFHSLEDRIVKRFMRDAAKGEAYPKGLPVIGMKKEPVMRLIGGARRPGDAEVAANPRARSAIMRVAEMLA